jgi:hypothetical protein
VPETGLDADLTLRAALVPTRAVSDGHRIRCRVTKATQHLTGNLANCSDNRKVGASAEQSG